MNLIDESFEPKKTDNSKKTIKIIIILMVILLVGIIATFSAIAYIQSTTFKFYLNGSVNEKVKALMVQENDGTIYFPIREIASYLGYESYNGEYTDKSEDASKCYIKCEDEIANFALNSNKIYKLTTSKNNSNYEYYYASKPVKAINGKLYATSDAIEKAFNISFTYDGDNRKAYIYTMPYLIDFYTSKVLDYGYEEINNDFTNHKSVLNNMLIVTKNKGKSYAVINTKGTDIIEAKYDKIEYLPNSGDFLVTSNNKVGIISANKEMKVQILYDSLELIDSDTGLYIAKKDNKYGVIDSKGNIKIYIEYDQIGVDISKFEKNEIKNKYLLDNGLIPVRKDKVWGAFDKNGKLVIDFEYDSFGYIASSNKDAINLLIIPDYNVMVGCKDKKYTLIDEEGKRLCGFVLDDVYMTISSGTKYYYMNYLSEIGRSVTDFLDETVVKTKNNKKTNQNTVSENTVEENVTNENEVEENTTNDVTE